MAKVFGLYKELDDVVGAVDALKASRFEVADIEIVSSIPYPPHTVGLPETRTQNQVWLSLGMGVAGTLFGFLLAGGTAWLYQLPTGGKPIIAMPTVGVIMYETTMLFAIWTAFFGALLYFKGWRSSREPYDRRLATGGIGLVVNVRDAARVGEAESAMAGAMEVSRWD
ncbi:hypothetical protein D3C87_969810 [compost metagenome]